MYLIFELEEEKNELIFYYSGGHKLTVNFTEEITYESIADGMYDIITNYISIPGVERSKSAEDATNDRP